MIKTKASITIEEGIVRQKYKWKSKKKTSKYTSRSRRAVIRISNNELAKKLKEERKERKQVNCTFRKEEGQWVVKIERTKKGSTLQSYIGSHPYLQLVVNKNLPEEIWEIHKKSRKKSITIPVQMEFNMIEWANLKIGPESFLLSVEKEAKTLLKSALKEGFKVNFVPKGREYDLELTGPKGKKFIIAISSHNSKEKSRNKENRKQKIMMDIAKILTVLKEKNATPVIISESLNFKNSWSHTTDKYFNFYKEEHGFRFLTLNFCVFDQHHLIKNFPGFRDILRYPLQQIVALLSN